MNDHFSTGRDGTAISTGVIFLTGRDGKVQRGGFWWRDGTVSDSGWRFVDGTGRDGTMAPVWRWYYRPVPPSPSFPSRQNAVISLACFAICVCFFGIVHGGFHLRFTPNQFMGEVYEPLERVIKSRTLKGKKWCTSSAACINHMKRLKHLTVFGSTNETWEVLLPASFASDLSVWYSTLCKCSTEKWAIAVVAVVVIFVICPPDVAP